MRKGAVGNKNCPAQKPCVSLFSFSTLVLNSFLLVCFKLFLPLLLLILFFFVFLKEKSVPPPLAGATDSVHNRFTESDLPVDLMNIFSGLHWV